MIYSLGDRRVEFLGEHYVAPTASLIGSVVMGNDASVWFNCVLRADNEIITIGERSNIQDATIMHADPGIPLTLGASVTVGHNAMLHGCTVGENTLIGISAVVLNHARIGRNCIVGAGTLITEGKEFPDGSLVLGSPGRVVRSLTDEEIAAVTENANRYVRKSAQYRASLSEG